MHRESDLEEGQGVEHQGGDEAPGHQLLVLDPGEELEGWLGIGSSDRLAHAVLHLHLKMGTFIKAPIVEVN